MEKEKWKKVILNGKRNDHMCAIETKYKMKCKYQAIKLQFLFWVHKYIIKWIINYYNVKINMRM